ncbi:YfjI family protein, partial [bacterium]|nr:YfjI family protein [bacterium]
IEYWETNGFPELRKDQRLVEKDLKKLEKSYERQDDATGRQQIGLEIQEIEAKKAELEKALAREPGFSVADITKEKLAVSLEQQPGQALASLSPEGRGVIDVLMGKYGKGGDSDEDLYLSAYSRERVKVSRINRPPVNLKTPCLSVLWLIQPDKARRLTESEAITESGLLPRFLICDSKAEAMDEPENPTGICHATIEKWDNLIRDLIETFRAKGNNPVTINADTNARRVIVDFKNENNARTRKGGDLKDITPFVARWAENAWRLALVFHAAKHGSEAGKHNLSHHTADKAVAIVRWFCQEQLSILAPKRNDRNRERLLKLISVLKDHEGTRTLRDLHKSNGFTNEEVEKLAEVFPKQIQVETIKPEKGGRPSKVANLI